MRVTIMKEYHDAPTAGHYGAEKTFQRIYWHATLYSRPAGLLQTPVPSQRFVVDLVGPLPETPRGNNWILIVKDTASKWTELFVVLRTTSETTAHTPSFLISGRELRSPRDNVTRPQSNCGFRELHASDYALPKKTRKNLGTVKRISSAEARPEKATTPEPVAVKRRTGRPKKMSVLDNAEGPTRSPKGERRGKILKLVPLASDVYPDR
ncbi:hypothetical protein Trydic_g22572 [Trypoxylus dichotomus]